MMNRSISISESEGKLENSAYTKHSHTVIKRVFVTLLILLLILPALGFTYETIMAAGDAERYPPTGQLLSVDGHTMHIHCVGEGSPTVLLEQGAGGFSAMWPETLIAELSQGNRVCAYDRAGYGWSDARPEPRMVWEIVHELHGLLSAAQVAPPYVLVGTSNGGLYIRGYAAEYPQESAGLILVAATSETELENIKGVSGSIFAVMGGLGIFRLFPELICPGSACDQASKRMIAAFRSRPELYTTVDAEWKGLQSPSELKVLRERLSPAGSLGDMPLVTLFANQTGVPESELPAGYRETLNKDRNLMTQLSSNSRYVVVMSGHGLVIEQPALVIQSVRDVIDAIKSGQPLKP